MLCFLLETKISHILPCSQGSEMFFFLVPSVLGINSFARKQKDLFTSAVRYYCVQTLSFKDTHSTPKKHRGSCNRSFYSIFCVLFYFSIYLVQRELSKLKIFCGLTIGEKHNPPSAPQS